MFLLLATHHGHDTEGVAKLVFGVSASTIIMTRKSRKLSAEVIKVDTRQIDELVDRASTSLSEEDAELFRKIVDSYSYLSEVIADKNTSINRLRKLMFGSSTEKTKNVVGKDKPQANPDPSASADDESSPDESNATDDNSNAKSAKRPGHGRMGADQYKGADHVINRP